MRSPRHSLNPKLTEVCIAQAQLGSSPEGHRHSQPAALQRAETDHLLPAEGRNNEAARSPADRLRRSS
jgi:hypothetical protein